MANRFLSKKYGKKGQMKEIAKWVLILLVLGVMLYFVYHYIVQAGFNSGFDPIINETINKSQNVQDSLF